MAAIDPRFITLPVIFCSSGMTAAHLSGSPEISIIPVPASALAGVMKTGAWRKTLPRAAQRAARSAVGVGAENGQLGAAVMPELQKMTGGVMNLGSKPERAAAFKLFGNLTLLGLSGVISDLVRLAHAIGVPPAEAVAMFKQFNPGEMLPARAEKIASGPYDPPSFTVSMARKDARLMIEEAARHN